MLSELKAVHDELHAAIAALETACGDAVPDTLALPRLRLALSRISSRRKAMIHHEILPRLTGLTGEVAARLNDLTRQGAGITVESAEHIAHWTMATIVADWAGYRRASAAMRAGMSRRIAEEADLLYPLLAARSDVAA